MKMFPEWFAGFCLAAVGIGALVPAAIMSIATANLFTRNLYGECLRRPMTAAEESRNAKLVSVFIKLGALAFVLLVRSQYAIELQLLGGIWIMQIFPAVVFGLFTRWFDGRALLLGWAGGMASGTAMAMARDLKSSIYPIHVGGHAYAMYAALPALAVNFVIAVLGSLLLRASSAKASDATSADDYLIERI
jgi:SSS family solute:Na+ symporter